MINRATVVGVLNAMICARAPVCKKSILRGAVVRRTEQTHCVVLKATITQVSAHAAFEQSGETRGQMAQPSSPSL